MKVLKFGGTSVGSVESIKSLLKIVEVALEAPQKPVVVLSAMGGVTNILLKMAALAEERADYAEELKLLEQKHFEVIRALLPVEKHNEVLTRLKLYFNDLDDLLQGVYSLTELTDKTKDTIVSFGERCSTYMVSRIANHHLCRSAFIDASQYILTDSKHGNGRVFENETYANIHSLYAEQGQEQLLWVTGFIAADKNGRVVTLGRGGSDYTAAIFGAALQAETIEIWTDVNGMMTADPRMVKKAFSLSELTYTEAMELSYFGAKVIYPPTLVPAFMRNIPIVIKNTFQPEFKGTFIQRDSVPTHLPIKGISSINKMSAINLQGSGMVGKVGFSGRLFSMLARENISVILITQSSSEHSITFAVQPENAILAQHLIQQEFELELQTGKLLPIQIEYNLSALAIVGENMKSTPGISGKLFHALGKNGINVRAIAQGSSEYNISIIIHEHDLAKALNAVHDEFFVEYKKTLNVFCLGAGNIGSTLFKQLLAQHENLRNRNGILVNVIAVSNTKKMYFERDGIDLNQWKSKLDASTELADLDTFTQKMIEMNLPNCVLIDNTASELPTRYYKTALESSISIVTCNKIANSASYAQYVDLQQTAKRSGASFFYETNVGAGLPIVRTLNDLITSGDRVKRIEAILSGTISYIFNHFKAEVTFHDIVKSAQEKGYTEPDPRDDLSGTDFMRKMLILARDAGYALEPSDVDLEVILPPSCLQATDVSSFYQSLISENQYFEDLKHKATTEDKVLRYIGILENGKVSIKLEFVGKEHPFYNLSGSDNIIAFYTDRYTDRPMVVQGPGAGTEVTAAGVFADLINVGNQ